MTSTLRPMSEKMITHQDLSSKPIKELTRLNLLITDMLSDLDNNKQIPKSLYKKIRRILLFQKGPFKKDMFCISPTTITVKEDFFRYDDLIRKIDEIKEYPNKRHLGKVAIDHEFSNNHRHYHQIVNSVRLCIIDATEQLDTIYKKETKPSRLSFLRKSK